jgi:hypothetical protein
MLFGLLGLLGGITANPGHAASVTPTPIGCEDPSGLLATINIPPGSPPPPPSLASQAPTSQSTTVYTYEHVTDAWLDNAGFMGRNRKFAVTVPPGYDPAKSYPLMVWLHGGCGDYDDHWDDLPEALKYIVLHPGDPNTDYENVYEYGNCVISGKIPHYGYMSNFSHYIDSTTGLERTSGELVSDALFVDYTQRRYRYYLDFVLSQFNVDPNRVFVRGHSKGGAGTVYTTLFNQDRIAGGISDVLRPNIITMGGSPDICNNDGYNAFDYADMAWWIQNHPDQMNFWIQTDHGKDDSSARFSWFNYPSPVSQNLSFFDTLEQYRVGHYTLWDEGGHEKNNGSEKSSSSLDPALGYHWWDGGWDVIDDPTSSLRLDKSFPAFSRFSYNQDYGVGPSETECKAVDGLYGTNLCAGGVTVAGDNRHNGAIAGVLNRHLRWDSNTIVDTADTYAIDIKVLDDAGLKPVGGSCGSTAPPGNLVYPACYEDYVGDGVETVDVTPRRLQNFTVSPGATISWESSTGQTGTLTADAYGIVTVPAFEVTTGWRTLTLHASSSTTPPVPDPAPDPVPAPGSDPAPRSDPTPLSGLYHVGEVDTPTPQNMLDHPDLAGASLRFTWAKLEPQEGVLDTVLLLDEVARAKAAGKKIQLRVLPGMETPEWVYAKGVPSMRFADHLPTGVPTGEVSRIPVPWDPDYLAAWASFIGRLGALVGAESEIVLVHMTGANSKSGEFPLTSGADPTDTTVEYLDGQGILVATGKIEDLFINQAGYSLDNIRMSWATSRDAWAEAFPTAMLSYNIVTSILNTDKIPDEVQRIVADAVVLYPTRLTLQNNSHNDSISVTKKLASPAYLAIQAHASGNMATGFQTGTPHGVCTGTVSGDLGPSLAVGAYIYGADYFELWETEIGKYPDVVHECNDFLLGRGSGCGTAGPLLCHLDAVPPTLSITSPVAAATLSGVASVSVEASDDTLVFGVTLLSDGVEAVPEQIVAFPSSTTFSLLLDTQTLSAGGHILTALARDVSGNTTTSTTLNVVVQHTDPAPVSEVCDGVDNDLDGLVDEGFSDTDKDGIADCVDSDDDNDGILDVNDAFPLDSTETTDTDGDGIGNNADSDDDNDGVSDADEIAAGLDPLDPTSKPEVCDGVDNDGDGLVDEGFSDTDRDGIADCVDPYTDVAVPVISGATVLNITATSAVVSWTTDESATSIVTYGVTSVSSDSLVTSHSLTLINLQAGTLYTVKVQSADAAGNTATGSPIKFTTLPPPDVLAPVISSVVMSGITATGAVASWTTNEAATSEVVDGNGTILASSASLVTSHSLTLANLQAGTTYSVAVRSSDAAGNTTTGSAIPFTTLPPPDVTPPTVSSVLIGGITTTGAVVTWTTNEAATSEVVVDGTGTILASSAGLVTSHSLTLANLQAGTTYSIAVRSSDAAGNTATGSAIAFTTLTDGPAKEEQAISGLTVKKIHRTKASVSWTTQLPAMSQIEYGTTTAYGKLSPRTSTYVTSHKVSLSSLSSTAVYHFRIHLWDEQGNLYTSEDQTFSLSTRTTARISRTIK